MAAAGIAGVLLGFILKGPDMTLSPEQSNAELSGGFSLARLIVLLLAGAFVLLMLDIREEHLEPIKHGYLFPWIPIVYSGIMFIACLVTFLRWRKPLRRMLMALFVLGIGVGLLGFWFHTHGHPLHAIQFAVQAWRSIPLPHHGQPPTLAPLSFVGLGLIGGISCSEWAQKH